VQVALGGGDLRVAHQRLDGRGVQTADGERREGVAQIVEGQRGQAGGVAREPEAAAQSGVVDRVARRAADDEVVGPGEPVTAAELVQDDEPLAGERDGAPFAMQKVEGSSPFSRSL
jgi:hypothetical protein